MLATVDAIIWTMKGPGESAEFFFVRSFPPNIGYDRFFSSNFRKRLFTDTVSVNKVHLTDTVSVNKVHLTDTVSLNKMYLTDTEPVNKDAPHRKIICV